MLLWNLGGCMNFFMQMSPESVAKYPESHRAIIEGQPFWATAGFGVAVFGGELGCMLLLIKSKWGIYLFIASFAGVIVTMIHTLDVARTKFDFSVFEVILMIVMPLFVAAFLILYSKLVESKGWVK